MSNKEDEIVWMSYHEFMNRVQDVEFARGFLAYCLQAGYQFSDFTRIEEIQYLPVQEVIDLAIYVWPMFYLREVPPATGWNN